MLPLALGRFMHLVVLNGFQGADADAEQLVLTEQLFDAAFIDWGLQRGAHQNPLPGKRDFGWPPG